MRALATAGAGGGAFCDHTAWPEFHNGVAAGLRLTPSGHQLTRTWIVYNKPEEPSYTHAGLLMALGLTGGWGVQAGWARWLCAMVASRSAHPSCGSQGCVVAGWC